MNRLVRGASRLFWRASHRFRGVNRLGRGGARPPGALGIVQDRPLAQLLCLVAALPLMAGCDNMKHQSHSLPMDPSPQFANGTSARVPPAHTVAQGLPFTAAAASGEKRGKPLTELPMVLTPALLSRGRDRYSIYCSPCHGDDGYGQGIVVQRGFPRPESFHSARLRAVPVGQLYGAISRGVGVMYPLGDRIAVSDRWAIVAYLRALQLSQHATLQDVPAPERAALLRP